MIAGNNIQVNSFTGGMDKDTNPFMIKPESYIHAENLRITTNEGLSSGALENIKGNLLALTLPSAKNVLNIVVDTDAVPTTGTELISVSLQYVGIVTETISWDSGYLGYIAALKNLFLNGNLSSIGFYFGQESSYSFNISCKININYIASANDYFTDTEIITEQTDLIYLGYGIIRDSVYLFTCSRNLSTYPNDSTGRPGQIWKLTYNKEELHLPSFAFNEIELVYHNTLNLSPEYPIRCIGRYENATTQRLYWTDYFNNVRTINVVDEDVFGISAGLLNLFPNTTLRRPAITKIKTGGVLKEGTYFAFYRLKRQGAETKFSICSNSGYVFYADQDTGVNWSILTASTTELSYQTLGRTTSKCLYINVLDLDTRFDTIELAIAYYEDSTETPLVSSVIELPIPINGELEYIYTGREVTTALSYSELTAFDSSFTLAKDIAVKDNNLIVANVKTKTYSNLEFNARAYRFKYNSDETYVSDWEVDPTSESISESDLNAINPDNTDPEGHTYKYQRNSTTIGGEGVNVKYEFVNCPLSYLEARWDTVDETTFENRVTFDRPIRANDPLTGGTGTVITTDLKLDYPYENGNTFVNFKSPIISSILKGYQRGEVYRFGIVLYDTEGLPGYVNWIGDIKFPENLDIFPVSSSLETYTLGIKFNINIPNDILSSVSGYSIVRVKRTEADKSVLGSGIAFPMINGTFKYPEGEDTYSGVGNMNPRPWGSLEGGETCFGNDYMYWTISIPEHQFKGISFSPGDYIKVTRQGSMDLAKIFADPVMGAIDSNKGQTYVMQDHGVDNMLIDSTSSPYILNDGVSDYLKAFTLDGAVDLPIAGRSFLNSATIYNYSSAGNYAFDDGNYSFGDKCLVVKFPSAVTYYGLMRTVIMTYCRTVLSQYGGNTEAARRNSVYQICNYFPVTSNTNSYECDAFDGDTFSTVYGITKYEAHQNGRIGADNITNAFPIGEYADEVDVTYGVIQGIVFPVETSLPVQWRRYFHFLNKQLPSSSDYPNYEIGGTNTQVSDTYLLEDIKLETDILSFIPKPNIELQSEFSARIYGSNTKIDGEEIDSWRKFEVIDYIDADGTLGAINGLINWRGEVFFFQDRAFGQVAINPVSLIQDQSGSTIELGVGKYLHKINYISTIFGSKHRFGLVTTDYAIYFFDSNNKKLFRYSEGNNPLSDIAGMSSYLATYVVGDILINDNPVLDKGISTVYDKRFNEVLFTFKTNNNSFTLAINDYIQKFISFYSFTPGLYISNESIVLTPNSSSLYLHNRGKSGNFYDVQYESILKGVVNKDSSIPKSFDFFNIKSEVYDNTTGFPIPTDTISSVRCYNDYQNTDYENITTTGIYKKARKVEQEWNIGIGRDKVINPSNGIFEAGNIDSTRKFSPRIRSNYMFFDMKYNNVYDRRIIIPYIKTAFNYSAR